MTKPVRAGFAGLRRHHRLVHRWASALAVASVLVVVGGCTEFDDVSPVTAPSDTAAPDDATTAPPVIVGIDVDWFGQPADDALPALEDQGFVVVALSVCTDAVASGAVFEITDGTGTVLTDDGGVTDAGREAEEGAALQVRIADEAVCE